jgi:hypothetical protein
MYTKMNDSKGKKKKKKKASVTVCQAGTEKAALPPFRPPSCYSGVENRRGKKSGVILLKYGLALGRIAAKCAIYG